MILVISNGGPVTTHICEQLRPTNELKIAYTDPRSLQSLISLDVNHLVYVDISDASSINSTIANVDVVYLMLPSLALREDTYQVLCECLGSVQVVCYSDPENAALAHAMISAAGHMLLVQYAHLYSRLLESQVTLPIKTRGVLELPFVDMSSVNQIIPFCHLADIPARPHLSDSGTAGDLIVSSFESPAGIANVLSELLERHISPPVGAQLAEALQDWASVSSSSSSGSSSGSRVSLRLYLGQHLQCFTWDVPYMPPELPTAVATTSSLLGAQHAASLCAHIPERLRHARCWPLLYSSATHGQSLLTVCRALSRCAASFVVIADERGHVFGGFMTSWSDAAVFTGNNQCFVFGVNGDAQGVHVYHWVSGSRIGYSSKACVGMGSDSREANFAWCLDEEFNGFSYACDTFRSPVLCSIDSESTFKNNFRAISVEIFMVEPEGDYVK